MYKIFTFAPENLAQNAETSLDRDGNEMAIKTPNIPQPKIRGMQGQTWTETIRTDDQYYEMVFPRMLAVAERAWHRASWELNWSPGVIFDGTTGLVPKDVLDNDYNGFASALGCREVVKLEKLGIAYRVPPPGASLDSSGLLSANSEMPCTTIMYSVDDGITWSEYSGPVRVGAGKVASLQSVSSNGVLKSRVVVTDGACSDCEGNPNSKGNVDLEPVLESDNVEDAITSDNGENAIKYTSTQPDGDVDSYPSTTTNDENPEASLVPQSWGVYTFSSGSANVEFLVRHLVYAFLAGPLLGYL